MEGKPTSLPDRQPKSKSDRENGIGRNSSFAAGKEK
jgi:hypothetical protein